MYGPFWIYTTLIFLLTFSENLHNYLLEGRENFESDFSNVPPSCFVIYGVGFGVPLALSFVMKLLTSDKLYFKEITCIYGYSFSCFLLCVLL
mmetsp:Transcript_8127/g.9226  ORF Transcript_8127/g.9226 Transcript_8127/m.9226 type:complete len:92 (-) Transcript_8127:158-433(-)